MDTLLVSPVKPVVIITAKAVPYFVLSTVILACIITISRFVLGVPIAGSLPVIALVSFIYIVLALSLGLLISTATHTQVAALLASGMVMLVPTLLLSGMIFPVESMPGILQYVSAVVPARWYISAVRKIMIMGARAIHHNRRDVCAARNDRNAACCRPEEFQRASEIKNIVL